MAIALTKPALGSTDWGGPVNTNWDVLMNALNGASAPDTQTLGYLTFAGLSAPAASPSGQGRIYFDSTAKIFKVSENAGAFTPLGSGGNLVFNYLTFT